TQSSVDVVVCPPFTALEGVARAVDGSLVKLGAQNMHFEASGAFTGEVSAPMLRALFATHVILGHSERRTLFGETDELVNKKVLSALKNQLRPIVCVGESLAEREAGSTLKVVQAQTERALDGVSKEIAASIIIAYEPVWAIGTGKVATTEQAQEVHGFIRGLLAKAYGDAVAQGIRILYGGWVKPRRGRHQCRPAEPSPAGPCRHRPFGAFPSTGAARRPRTPRASRSPAWPAGSRPPGSQPLRGSSSPGRPGAWQP